MLPLVGGWVVHGHFALAEFNPENVLGLLMGVDAQGKQALRVVDGAGVALFFLNCFMSLKTSAISPLLKLLEG